MALMDRQGIEPGVAHLSSSVLWKASWGWTVDPICGGLREDGRIVNVPVNGQG